jgi:chemotaxis signal transduction protein
VEQYLTFRVARQELALDASRVRGILPARDTTPSIRPGPCWLSGLAALQGRYVPVVHLGKKLNIPAGGPRGRTPSVVVVEVIAQESARLVGFAVDSISEIREPTAKQRRVGALLLRGRRREILDLDRVFSHEELKTLEESLRLGL